VKILVLKKIENSSMGNFLSSLSSLFGTTTSYDSIEMYHEETSQISPSYRYDVENMNSYDSDHVDEIEEIYTDNDINKIPNKMFTHHGVKKALIIGINYSSNDVNDDDLRGCLNDSYNIEKLLKGRCHFEQSHITKLNDMAASKHNIITELEKLVEFSHRHDNSEVWLSFSGHGGGVYDFYEEDNQKEFICPSDYLSSGIIEDTWLKMHFINKLSKTTKCFVLMDCCNSGSNMNLPYIYENSSQRCDDDVAKIVKISGSMDNQTSADYYDVQDRSFQGALTNSFLKSVDEEKHTILSSYDNSKHDLSIRKFTQVPQLSFTDSTLINYSLY